MTLQESVRRKTLKFIAARVVSSALFGYCLPTINKNGFIIMSIETYGTGARLRIAARLLEGVTTDKRLILLPVPSTRDKKHIKDTDILLDDTLSGAGADTLAVGYGLPDRYTAALEAAGAKLLDLAHDEEYLCDNAKITAYGALGYILTTTPRAPEDLRFGIVGYGRIGSELSRMLLFLGAHVRVYTSRTLTRLELGECGMESAPSSDIYAGKADFSGLDILINTAPKDMRGCFEESGLPDGMRLLELASGENFADVAGVERLPALPERMYPESAGRAYFDAVVRFLKTNP